MAHFAQIDSNNIVQVVNVVNDTEAVSGQAFLNSLGLTGTWLQTSYNSHRGLHYTQVPAGTAMSVQTVSSMRFNPLSGGRYTAEVKQISSTYVTYALSADGKPHFRYNYAGIGYYYDSVRDAFIPPKLHSTWVLEASSCTWIPPIPTPEDYLNYTWSDALTSWVPIA